MSDIRGADGVWRRPPSRLLPARWQACRGRASSPLLLGTETEKCGSMIQRGSARMPLDNAVYVVGI